MKTFSKLAVVVAFAAAAVGQDGPRIETPPNVVVCQPTLLTWNGGTPPYFLSILPGGQPQAQPLEQFTNLEGNTFTWKADQPAGTSVTLTIRDSTGATGSSAPVPINSGPDTSCLNGGGESSGSSSAGASSTSAASSGSVSASGSASSSSVSQSSTPATSAETTSGATTSAPATSGTGATSSTRPATTSGQQTSSPAPSPTGADNNSGAVGLIASSGFSLFVGSIVAAVVA